jgi:hypothetical protein
MATTTTTIGNPYQVGQKLGQLGEIAPGESREVVVTQIEGDKVYHRHLSALESSASYWANWREFIPIGESIGNQFYIGQRVRQIANLRDGESPEAIVVGIEGDSVRHTHDSGQTSTSTYLDFQELYITPELKPRYKIGQKVTLISSGNIYAAFAGMASYLQATCWESEFVFPNGTVGVITNLGLHLDRPNDGFLYLFKSGNKEVVVGERGLTSELPRKIPHWPYHVGQKVRIRKELKENGYSPNLNSSMLQYVGRECYIEGVRNFLSSRWCSISFDNTDYWWDYSWLELIPPILRKDKAPKIEKFKTINFPEVELSPEYIEWIRHPYRREVKYSSKCFPEIPYEFKTSDPASMTVQIEGKLFKELFLVFCEFMTHWGYRPDNYAHQSAKPCCFLLGEQDGVVSKALPLNWDKFAKVMSGCGQMTEIRSEELSTAICEMNELGFQPCGIARVGVFPTKNSSQRGESLSDLMQMFHESRFFVLSIGRDTMLIESLDKHGNLHKHNYIIKNFKKGGKSAIKNKEEQLEMSSV